MLVCDYIVKQIDGDYAHLQRTDQPEEEMKVVARALLPAEIYALTLPYHFHLSTEEFKAIVEAPNVEEMKKQIENTYYGTHVHMKEGQSIEKSIKDILRDLYISDRQKDPYSDATMHAFLFLKEQEIDKLTTALECIRYGLTRQEILTYLGGESK